MKKILLLIIAICLALPALAENNMYEKYYNIDSDNISLILKDFSGNEEKLLSKTEKKTYKKCKKINKLLMGKKYKKALKVDKTNLAIYSQMLQEAIIKKNYFLIQNYVEEILLYDENYIFERDVLNKLLVEAAYNNHIAYANRGNFEEAIISLHQAIYYDQYNILNINECEYMLANYYYITNNYVNVIIYLKSIFDSSKTKNEDDAIKLVYSFYQTQDYKNVINYSKYISSKNENYNLCLEMLFLSYCELNELELAHSIAIKLFNENYPNTFLASKRVASTTKDLNKQLKYLNIAKNNTSDNVEIFGINLKLAKIYQKKLEQKASKNNLYIQIPDWDKIVDKDLNYMRGVDLNSRFENYQKSIINCLNYNGNNLRQCCADIIDREDKISTEAYNAEQARKQQLLELERINQLQQMNYNMTVQNNLIRQQNYELSRPRYYNSTTTQYGNSYYTNGYSY